MANSRVPSIGSTKTVMVLYLEEESTEDGWVETGVAASEKGALALVTGVFALRGGECVVFHANNASGAPSWGSSARRRVCAKEGRVCVRDGICMSQMMEGVATCSERRSQWCS